MGANYSARADDTSDLSGASDNEITVAAQNDGFSWYKTHQHTTKGFIDLLDVGEGRALQRNLRGEAESRYESAFAQAVEGLKHAKHPAVACYEEVFKRVTSDGSGEIPNAEEPVGRARFDAKLDRRGIEYPENFIDYFQWWIDIGGQKACARLGRQWRKTKENPE